MNVRKPVDYSAMFEALDTLMAADLPQMELYCGIGRLVSGRPEKGAAVAAAEYLCAAHPDASGFSPRNLRRMREFYRTYESAPEVLADAMTIGWTQNVIILEAELTSQEQAWYIKAAGQFGWSKLELSKKIQECVHETRSLDSTADPCYSNSSRKSASALPERERDNVAEKSNPRSPARGEVPGLYGLCAAVSPPGTKSEKAGAPQTIAPPPKILTKLLKWTVHTLEIFWWEEDYCGPADAGPEEETSLWSVHVEYSNGEVQDMESADDLPDHVLELLFALAELFE